MKKEINIFYEKPCVKVADCDIALILCQSPGQGSSTITDLEDGGSDTIND